MQAIMKCFIFRLTPLLVFASGMLWACDKNIGDSWKIELPNKKDAGIEVRASISKEDNSAAITFQFVIINSADRPLCVPAIYDGYSALDRGIVGSAGNPRSVDYHFTPFPADSWDSYVLIRPGHYRVFHLTESRREIMDDLRAVDLDVVSFFCDSLLENEFPSLADIVFGTAPDDSSGSRIRYENIEFPATR